MRIRATSLLDHVRSPRPGPRHGPLTRFTGPAGRGGGGGVGGRVSAPHASPRPRRSHGPRTPSAARFRSGGSRRRATRSNALRSLFDLAGVRARFGEVTAPDPRSATMLLRDLSLRVGQLSGPARETAERLLARPTDGGPHPFNDGYSVSEETPECSEVCVHYVASTPDMPDPEDADFSGVPDYVETVSSVLDHVWARGGRRSRLSRAQVGCLIGQRRRERPPRRLPRGHRRRRDLRLLRQRRPAPRTPSLSALGHVRVLRPRRRLRHLAVRVPEPDGAAQGDGRARVLPRRPVRLRHR